MIKYEQIPPPDNYIILGYGRKENSSRDGEKDKLILLNKYHYKWDNPPVGLNYVGWGNTEIYACPIDRYEELKKYFTPLKDNKDIVKRILAL